MPKITPFLWFNDNLEEALAFYSSVFKNLKVLSVSRYSAGAPRPAGTVMTASIEIGTGTSSQPGVKNHSAVG